MITPLKATRIYICFSLNTLIDVNGIKLDELSFNAGHICS